MSKHNDHGVYAHLLIKDYKNMLVGCKEMRAFKLGKAREKVGGCLAGMLPGAVQIVVPSKIGEGRLVVY